MQDAIKKLKSMGPMPSDSEDITDERLEAYEELLKVIQTDDSTYQKIIQQCPSNEWSETLSKRYDNYLCQ